MSGIFKKLLKPFRESHPPARSSVPDITPSKIARGVDHALRGDLFGVNNVRAALKRAIDEKKETEPLVDQLMYACDCYKYSLNNFAEYLKFLAGLEDTTFEAVSIRELLRGLLDDCRNDLRDKQLALELKVDDNIPEQLAGDNVRISLLLWNLLHHAIETADPGSRIHIWIRRDGGDDWVMEIRRESGKPVNPDHFFELTEVEGPSSENAMAGNLELHITRYLAVERLQGKIGVTMEENACKYLVSLPYL
jgi:signal transduction histidine kinase